MRLSRKFDLLCGFLGFVCLCGLWVDDRVVLVSCIGIYACVWGAAVTRNREALVTEAERVEQNLRGQKSDE